MALFSSAPPGLDRGAEAVPIYRRQVGAAESVAIAGSEPLDQHRPALGRWRLGGATVVENTLLYRLTTFKLSGDQRSPAWAHR